MKASAKRILILCLSLRQISRLEQTWVTLRQRHTEGAILYEKKLKPFMKNINDGKGEISVVGWCHTKIHQQR